MNFTVIPSKPMQITSTLAPNTKIATRFATPPAPRLTTFRACANAVDAADRFAAERQSLYEILGIAESASAVDIKRAFKQLALKYHPDVLPQESAAEHTRRFIEVKDAYATLSDPGRRAVYDQDLAGGVSFEAKARRSSDEELESWRSHWQGQLVELTKKREHKNSENELSWGAKMRQRHG